MDELIKTEQNENGEILVTGRDLHEFLDISTEYKKWFNRMTEYGFNENEDFIRVTQKSPTLGGIQNISNHHIKLNMAKEISMIQRNEKGKQARQYFIEVEKRWNSPEMIVQRAMQIQDKKVKELETRNSMLLQQNKEMKPKADYTSKILKNKGLVTISQIAKDYGMSPQAMNKLLNEYGVQYKRSGQWLLYSEYHAKGYTHSETVDIEKKNGEKDIRMITKWTQKGRLFIYDLLKENEILPIIEQ